MSKAWIYLYTAAFFETGWTYALKYMSFSNLKSAWTDNAKGNILEASVPFIAYLLFGGANIFCLSEALKSIPTATAIAIWTAVSLVLVKICDIYYFKINTNIGELFFMSLIVIGIVGMKQFSAN